MSTDIDIKVATDGQLMERFGQARDQLTFEEIVRRHGPMAYATANRLHSITERFGQAMELPSAEKISSHLATTVITREETR